MAITDTQLQEAARRGAELEAFFPRAIGASLVDGRLAIRFANEMILSLPIHEIQGFERATAGEIDQVEISPSGLGLHFPRIDADLYIPSLISGVLGNRAWMSERGRKGGAATTEAKAEAARNNGKLGGRPPNRKTEIA